MLLGADITVDLGTILAVGGPVVAAAGTVAVMKWRQNMLEEKQKEAKTSSKEDKEKLERVDERIFEEIKNINKTMQRRFNEQDKNHADAEKSMVGKIEGFQSKVFRRFDDVQEKLSEHERRLSVAETEAKHTKEKVDKHAQKITMFGKTPFKREDS